MSKFVESSGAYLTAAAARGVTPDLFQSEPDERVVITGIAAITPYGNAGATWEGMMNWHSPVTTIDTGNYHTRLALGDMNFIRGEHLQSRPERILTNAFGFGGNNAVVEIGQYIP